MLPTVATIVNLGQKCKHVSGLAGLGEHAFITAIGLNQRMFWLKCLGQNSVCSLFSHPAHPGVRAPGGVTLTLEGLAG